MARRQIIVWPCPSSVSLQALPALWSSCGLGPAGFAQSCVLSSLSTTQPHCRNSVMDKIRHVITRKFSFDWSNNTSLIPVKSVVISEHIQSCICAACKYMSVATLEMALTSVKRVTKMKAPAESGQASWSQISRTWLKHIVTSTADELCFACCTGSSCPKKRIKKWYMRGSWKNLAHY